MKKKTRKQLKRKIKSQILRGRHKCGGNKKDRDASGEKKVKMVGTCF